MLDVPTAGVSMVNLSLVDTLVLVVLVSEESVVVVKVTGVDSVEEST